MRLNVPSVKNGYLVTLSSSIAVKAKRPEFIVGVEPVIIRGLRNEIFDIYYPLLAI
ncbi:MAG: hypothetical protein GOVbin8609_63 [Prokaryotic dsDNA virus sp.]|nr:MAG: hypothetical protein GOVbin8609_63 [Prokaryotic dsDNA virus sp.]